MSLNKIKNIDKVEFVGKYKTLQVRYVTEVTDNEEVIAQSYERNSYSIEIGIEGLPAELQAYATGVWSDELLVELQAEQAEYLAQQEAENAEWYAQQQALEETE